MIAQVQNNQEIPEYNGETPLKGKREKFAQEIAKGDCNHTEAARTAKYRDHKGLRRYVYLMTTIPAIKARIKYLQAKMAEKFDITKETQLRQYLDVVKVCDETGDMANKNKALNSIDKLFGLSIDKTETTESQKALDKAEASECSRIAALRLRESLVADEPVSEVVLDDV